MADPKKAVARTYQDAYSDDTAGRKAQYADRLNALNDRALGGSFQSVGKKNGRDAYRDRRSGKTFYVNQRGEIIKGSGEKDTSRWAQELDQRVVKAVDKNFANQFEQEQRKLGNRSYDPDEGKTLQQQLTSQGIKEGKNIAEASEAANQVEREDRIAYKIKKDLEGAQGYADPDEVARRTASLTTQSPIQKRSPLLQFANPYAGNYSALSQAVGGGVKDAIDEQKAAEDRRREQERQDLNTQIQQNAFAQQKIKQAEALVVPGDTGYNSLDGAINKATRSLADQAGNLTNQLKNNEIDIDQYAQQYATIQSQIPGIKAFKETLTANLQGYQEGLANGQLSKANGLQTNDLYATMMSDDGSLDLGVDEAGRVMFTGQTLGGEPISIPVNGANQMPKPIFKQPSPYELIKPTLTELEKSLNVWDDAATETIKGQLDIVLEEGGEPALKSLAVDHYGISLEEANRLSDEPAENHTNALEKYVEEKFVNDAQIKFKADQLTAAQQADLAFKKQQLYNKQQQGGGNTAAAIKQQNEIIQREQNTQILNTAVAGGKDKATGLIGVGGITGVNPHWRGQGFEIVVGDEKYDINYKGDKITPQSKQILNNLLGLGAVGGQDVSQYDFNIN